jgi:hypothetical protein
VCVGGGGDKHWARAWAWESREGKHTYNLLRRAHIDFGKPNSRVRTRTHTHTGRIHCLRLGRQLRLELCAPAGLRTTPSLRSRRCAAPLLLRVAAYYGDAAARHLSLYLAKPGSSLPLWPADWAWDRVRAKVDCNICWWFGAAAVAGSAKGRE